MKRCVSRPAPFMSKGHTIEVVNQKGTGEYGSRDAILHLPLDLSHGYPLGNPPNSPLVTPCRLYHPLISGPDTTHIRPCHSPPQPRPLPILVGPGTPIFNAGTIVFSSAFPFIAERLPSSVQGLPIFDPNAPCFSLDIPILRPGFFFFSFDIPLFGPGTPFFSQALLSSPSNLLCWA